MKKIQIAGLSALTIFGSLSAVNAQSATTDPVGYTTVTCLANSDTIVSVPFLNSTDSISSSVSGSATADGTKAEFTMSGVSGLTTDQYATLYYVRFTSGTLEGNVYQITNNGADSVKIELNGDASTDITSGDTFKIYKFWTLGSLFPVGNDTIEESTGNLAFQRKSSILLPDNTSDGIQHAPAATYFLKSTGWTNNSNTSEDSSNVILWPDTYFIIRHSSLVQSATTYTATGTVDTHAKTSIPLSTRTDGPQDNYVSIPRPIDVKLNELNLFESGSFTPSTGNLSFQRRDQLLVFDNGVQAQRKAPSKIYFHNGTNWVDNGNVTGNADEAIIKASQGIIIRKYQTNDGATIFWNNTPTY
ncbi:TIGR02597 family protein [Rubritalea tangerina]|uniref:TIGR02597 family protein n=1 Tax=Rubritalea tangerina TaxID=430798 RepID=A0ABW4ZB52_9BACT